MGTLLHGRALTEAQVFAAGGRPPLLLTVLLTAPVALTLASALASLAHL